MNAATAILVVVPDMAGPAELYKIPIHAKASAGLRVVTIEEFVRAATRLAIAAQEQRIFPRDHTAAEEMDLAIDNWRTVVMGLES